MRCALDRRQGRLALGLAGAILLTVAPTPCRAFTFTNIDDTTGTTSGYATLQPSVNSSGVAAFFAGVDIGGVFIYKGAGGPTTTIADISGIIAGFGSPSISSSGVVAFRYVTESDAPGIFVEGVAVTLVPEPSGLALVVGSGVLWLGGISRRRCRVVAPGAADRAQLFVPRELRRSRRISRRCCLIAPSAPPRVYGPSLNSLTP